MTSIIRLISAKPILDFSWGKRENVVMVTKGFVNMVTVADLRVMVTHFYSIELW